MILHRKWNNQAISRGKAIPWILNAQVNDHPTLSSSNRFQFNCLNPPTTLLAQTNQTHMNKSKSHSVIHIQTLIRSLYLIPGTREWEMAGKWLLLMLVLVMGWSVTLTSASFGDRYRGRKAFLPAEATSSLAISRAPSSVVLPVHGNVYPIG